MKSKTLKIVFSVCLSLVIIACLVASGIIYVQNRNKKMSLEVTVNKVLSESADVGEASIDEAIYFSKELLSESQNVIGRLIIDKIKVVGPIIDGTTKEVLREGIGHFTNSKYWNGNVCLASHNSGSFAHYFEKLNMLQAGDIIEYQTKLGTKKYVVDKVSQINETDLSVLNNTQENVLTLITCVKMHPELRLCVRATEVK